MWDLVFTVLNHPDKAVKGEFSAEDELGPVSYTHLRAHET